jgi:hypothetical protein
MTDQNDDVDDDTYVEDKDAAPTLEGRVAQMRGELRKLLSASAAATLLIGGAVAVVDVWRQTGFVNLCGYLVGAAVATVNLWLLAGGYFQVLRGSRMSAQALVAFLGSFVGLVLLAAWIVFTHRAWTLGFALGLTTPAVAGMLYGRTLK